jgi:hypothetical protein
MSSSAGWGGVREGAGRKPAGYVPPAEKADLDRERAEHERVKRLQREFQLAIQQGMYLRRDAYRQASATALATLTQALRTIPDNCERQFALPPDVVQSIQDQVDAALSDAALAFRRMAGDG